MVVTYQAGFDQYKWIQVPVELSDEECDQAFYAIRNLAIERAVEQMEGRGWIPMTRPALVSRRPLIVGARWREVDDGPGDASGDDALQSASEGGSVAEG